ncbi:hypothetical protein CVT24_007118 [Panaeolus cyanescens]|uniref:PX domain-containing protein n=1 Tax=Panaeolus cyanescens TaxID=181874 RepID=A0A409VJY0_9AGAR|nr:hypothetical protein CVT24_007118 [Panaeolus cyanescens]
MATLPRSRIGPSPLAAVHRQTSDFDAGINTSAAWTESLESGDEAIDTISKARNRRFFSESNLPNSPVDEERDDEIEQVTQPARALYDFEGKPEFRELCVKAGDDLELVKEDVGEGWSLMKDATGEVGLLPQTYYSLTADFVKSREPSASSITPKPSPRTSQIHIIPQNTGDWLPSFPSFRQSLLGGKTLNRFSSFVTSGAEAFLLNGPPESSNPEPIKPPAHAREDTSASMAPVVDEQRRQLALLGLGEADRHYVEAGRAGPTWRRKTPPFHALVHSPSKRTSGISGAYTMYNVTSLFPSTVSHTPTDWVEVPDPDDVHPPSPTTLTKDGETAMRITVQRRFSHFVMLHTVLSRRLPGIALPPLPEKQYAGRFNEDFVEARRGDLERYLNKIIRHPVVRYAEVVMFFLSCESDSEWNQLLPQHLSAPPAGATFYTRIFHPAFNVDLEDSENALQSFHNHTRAVGKGVQALRSIFGKVREARVEMSKAERLLSYSLLGLITSKHLASPGTPGTTDDDDADFSSNQAAKADLKGLTNNDGAWCWRDNCPDCLSLTKATQRTSETLQTIANLYDGHARRTQLTTHESLKLMAHPTSLYESVTTTHKSTLTRYREVLDSKVTGKPMDDDLAARCETVLNVTMAEMDVYHAQRAEDLKATVVDHLDGEIAFYEQVLMRLKVARAQYDEPQYTALAATPRQPSMYEKDLLEGGSAHHLMTLTAGSSAVAPQGNLALRPLPQPCPHVFDSAPMRPVSVALQEGVGMFLGERGTSMFGKFW